jgi:predicted RND superfamily exporter protein
MHRYDVDGREGTILGAMQTTGGAIVLCSLTTTVGYLALLGSMNQAIRSLGLVAVAGEVTCLCSAMLALTGTIRWREALHRR